MAETIKGTTNYVVLRQTADGRWDVAVQSLSAAGSEAAVKHAAANDAKGDREHAYRDVFVAVPARSWQPMAATVKREPTVTLKAVK